jgi:hypothetical protein
MTKIKEFAKAAFGTGLGLAGNLLLGMLFLIPGFLIVTRENRKPRSSRNTGLLVVGFLLMILGVVLGLGMGADELFKDLKNEF